VGEPLKGQGGQVACSLGQIIKSYNEVFLDKVEERIRDWNDETCLGDLFIEMVRKETRFFC
jgi:hypothetical protein